MCFYITIALPEQHADALRSVVGELRVRAIENRSVLAVLPPGYQTFLLTTVDHCSCQLYQRERRHDDAEQIGRLKLKYSRKGWSQAKVDRAVEQSIASWPADFVGFREDVTAALIELAKSVPRFAVLVHWYDGSLEDEQIDFGSPQRIEASRLGDVVPTEDRLLWIDGRNEHV